MSPNGVDIAIYDPVKVNSERLCIRKKLNLEERYVFGFVGTFSYWHGIEVLSYMIPKLAKLTSKIHFLLVGDGPLKKILEKELEEANINNEYVTFTGAIAHELVPSYLATCDAFLCPTQPNSDGSRFFGSPIKLFEYLSMSKPIIASELEQLKEILSPAILYDDLKTASVIQDASVGILVPPKNYDAFVEAAYWLMHLSPETKLTMSLIARQQALKHTWTKRIAEMKLFIEEDL